VGSHAEHGNQKYYAEHGNQKYYAEHGNQKYYVEHGNQKYYVEHGNQKYYVEHGNQKFHAECWNQIKLGLENAMQRTIVILALIAAAAGSGQNAPPAAPARPAVDRPKPKAVEEKKGSLYEENKPPSALQQIEQEVLKLLSEGKQSEAEKMLAKHIKSIPEYEKIRRLFVAGKPDQAQEAVQRNADAYRDNQRLLFLYAACGRSRFDVEEALPRFLAANMAQERTAVGQGIAHIVALDVNRQDADVHFDFLEELVQSYPDEIVLRWMLAVECRSYNRNEQGVVHYKKILEKWKPGPVLVHQTYANLLDQLARFEEALVERRKAVELEPAGWSYDGLGNTLDNLGRYDEADKAHAKATELSPKNGHHLANWAKNAFLRKKYDEAIEKCERSFNLNPSYLFVLKLWAQSLEAKGDKAKALEKYQELFEKCPDETDIQKKIEELEKELKQKPVQTD
jgi:tetratricopeptide (TPR) repeat protein